MTVVLFECVKHRYKNLILFMQLNVCQFIMMLIDFLNCIKGQLMWMSRGF